MLYIIDDLLDDDDVIFIDADVGIPNVKDVARTQTTNTYIPATTITKNISHTYGLDNTLVYVPK